MDDDGPAYIQQISPEDWQRTPPPVKKLVEQMAAGIGQLQKKLDELQAEQQQLLTYSPG
jgi:hypothetical protein